MKKQSQPKKSKSILSLKKETVTVLNDFQKVKLLGGGAPVIGGQHQSSIWH